MKETSKCYQQRLKDNIFELYLKGDGIDIGSGVDPLQIPNGTVKNYDGPGNDAQFMAGIDDYSFDFVYSSHCLEHLGAISIVISNWIRICKPNGYIYIVVPDEELYEKNHWPSKFNIDHKYSFTLKKGSKLPQSIYLPDFFDQFKHQVKIIKMFVNSQSYDSTLPDNIDQTRKNASCQIEIILQKKLPYVIKWGGRGFGDRLLTSAFVHILNDNNIPAVLGHKNSLLDCPQFDPTIHDHGSHIWMSVPGYSLEWKDIFYYFIDIFQQRSRIKEKLKIRQTHIPIKFLDLPETPHVDVTMNTKAGSWTPYRDWPFFKELKILFDKNKISYIDLDEKGIVNEECLNYVQKAKIYLGLETGMSHFVSQIANGKALILQSGYTNRNFWARLYNYDFLAVSVDCAPCYITRTDIANGKECQKNHECMRLLTPEYVLVRVQKKIKQVEEREKNSGHETGIWPVETAEKRHVCDLRLAVYISMLYSPERAADLGCGTGLYCRILKARDWPVVHGYEGTLNIQKVAKYDDIRVMDLSKEIQVETKYDFVFCTEVGEHIPKQYEQTLINNICNFASKDLVMSWAYPGQGGKGHFNEQPHEYIISEFVKRGFIYNEKRSEDLRKLATLKWLQRNMMVFYRG